MITVLYRLDASRPWRPVGEASTVHEALALVRGRGDWWLVRPGNSSAASCAATAAWPTSAFAPTATGQFVHTGRSVIFGMPWDAVPKLNSGLWEAKL